MDLVSGMTLGRIEEAFRLMQSGRHSGEIVVTANDDDQISLVPRELKPIESDPNARYLLSGGLGGLGWSIGEWMVDHGARHLLFLSRSGPAKPEVQETLTKRAKTGAHAVTYSCDIGNSDQITTALAKHREGSPPIQGAMVGNYTDGSWTRPTKTWLTSSGSRALSRKRKEVGTFIAMSNTLSCVAEVGKFHCTSMNER